MAVFMAVAGFGIGSRAGSFEVRAEKQEAKADDKKSTDSDAKEEETTKEQESTQEAVTEDEGIKAERRLPEGFSVSGLDDGVKTMTALSEALEKLQLNDASLQFDPETSQALGFGFRCGFLGLLHMDVIQERLEREFNIDLIMTAPSVNYKVNMTDGESLDVSNPSEFPEPTKIDSIEEPYVKAQIMVPQEFVGAVMELAQRKRGDFVTMDYIDENRVNVIYQIPLAEIVFDFFDKLKSSTRGYASFDYEISEYRKSSLVKMDILLNGDKVDALSFIVHKEFAYERGKLIVEKLKKIIPRQQFEVPIQAAIGQKIVARTDIKALRKNVLAKCYGGDVSRKRKLLEKQKAGKKRMKAIGSVEVPQEAFLSVLSMDDE